jgi:hypothetical protein
MLIESLAGLVLVRRRPVALRLGGAVGEPLFGGVAFGFAACGALAGNPQVDDLSHANKPQCLTPAFRANCADTVAGWVVGVRPPPRCAAALIWARHGSVSECNGFRLVLKSQAERIKDEEQLRHLTTVVSNHWCFVRRSIEQSLGMTLRQVAHQVSSCRNVLPAGVG